MYYSGMLKLLTEAKLRLESGACGVLPPTWSWDCPGSEHWRGLVLWAVLEGDGRIEEDGDIIHIGRGDVLVMRFDRPRRGRHDPARPLVVPWCVFDLPDPDARGALTDCPPINRYRLQDIDFGAGCLRRAVDDAQLGGDQIGAARWLRTFFHELSRPSLITAVPCDDERSGLLDTLADEMRRHPERRVALTTLAARADYDPDHLARIFRQRFGQPPGRYAIHCRIDRARTLLRFTDQTIAGIAERLGYHDPYFFSRQFTRVTGLSPSAYRDGR